MTAATAALAPKTILITGASDGIGAAAALQLHGAGHRVIVVGRDAAKTRRVADAVGSPAFTADFASLDAVRGLAASITDHLGDSRLDVLANNAGGIFGERQLTGDGLELTMQVNHFAPFLLTALLRTRLAPGAAVVNTSSVANRLFGDRDPVAYADFSFEHGYSANRAYGNAKLANVLFTRALHRRFGSAGESGINAVAFHPGNVASNFAADSSSVLRFAYRTPLRRLVLISSEKGGANLAHFAGGTPGADWQPGAYYDERRPTTRINPLANDETVIEALWQRSVGLTGADWSI